MGQFKYYGSKTCYYNGIKFDSHLELTYAISIEEDHVYAVHPQQFYERDLDSGKIVITELTRSYKPDFLIRSFGTNVASYIEVKPEMKFEKREELRRSIMKQNIANSEIVFDWVIENDIELNAFQKNKFKEILKSQKEEKSFHLLANKLYRGIYKYPFNLNYNYPSWSFSEYKDFLKEGTYPFMEE